MDAKRIATMGEIDAKGISGLGKALQTRRVATTAYKRINQEQISNARRDHGRPWRNINAMNIEAAASANCTTAIPRAYA